MIAARRATLVRAALLAAMTASLWLLAASGEQPLPVERAPNRAEAAAPSSPAASAEGLRVDLLRREAQERSAEDLFAAHSWQRPAPAPVQKVEAPPPEPPSAPPLPFTFLGSFETADGKPVYYLVEGDQMHTVSAGEVVNGLWRVEAVGVDEMVLLYLPLSIRQPLALGGAK